MVRLPAVGIGVRVGGRLHRLTAEAEGAEKTLVRRLEEQSVPDEETTCNDDDDENLRQAEG